MPIVTAWSRPEPDLNQREADGGTPPPDDRWQCAQCAEYRARSTRPGLIKHGEWSPLTRNWEDEVRYCRRCVVTCVACDRVEPTNNESIREDGFHDGEMRCEDCVTVCPHCEERFTDPDGIDRVMDHDARWVHTSCVVACPGCDEWFGLYERDCFGSRLMRVVSDHPNRVCVNCVNYCSRCDGEHFGEECNRGIRNVSDYGHTAGSIWLGGPLPRDENDRHVGYFIGIENEISANSGDADVVRQWAQTHLGHWEAMDCKEDGSVEGFEIVTQPMTPEFFESVDWESFFDMLNAQFPISGNEPDAHGLHVHIGRIAFERDPVALAAYTYLLGQDRGSHLERIGRRSATGYCARVRHPGKAGVIAALGDKYTIQRSRLANEGVGLGRDSINLAEPYKGTVEVRAFRATRSANELREAVRLVYIAAEYIRHLRKVKLPMSNAHLRWSTFARWVAVAYPEAFESIAGLPTKGSNKKVLV